MTPFELFGVVLLTLGTVVLVLFGLSAALSAASKLAARWRRGQTRRLRDRIRRAEVRLTAAQKLLIASLERESELRSLLDGSRRREKALNNQLADLNDREHPFPDIAPAAGSLGDQVEAWLATNPTSED